MVAPAAMLAIIVMPLLIMTSATIAVAIIVMRQGPARGREHSDADRRRENERYNRFF
jgi:hypothetical protein